MKNNKGFSLVELLAVLAILGILFVIGITAYSRYKVKARKQGYETMAKSASQAASEYKMDHPSATAVTFDTLHKNGYLSSLNDPGSKNSLCSGSVNIKTNSGTSSSLDEEEYTVAICCSNYNYTYYYPAGNKVKNNSGCYAEENMNPTIPEYDITYKITYDIQGGKACKPSSKNVFTNEGQPVTWGTLCKPTRTNYEFNGWYTSDGKEITSKTEATGDIRVYAHWTPRNIFTYKITYDTQGGKACKPSSKTVSTKYGQSVVWGTLCAPTRQQYTFDGWYTSSGTKITSETEATDNITVYAHWTPKNTYMITYDSNGGSECNPSSKTVSTEQGQSVVWGTLCAPTKKHYTFDGWYTSSGTKVTSETEATGDITVSAHWSPVKYTIKLSKGTGIKTIKLNNSATLTQELAYGTEYTYSVTTVNDYYHFTKWTDGSNNNISTEKVGTRKVTGNITLTANGAKNNLYLHYYTNGGTLIPGTKQICRDSINCSPDICERENYAGCTGSKTGLVYRSYPAEFDSNHYEAAGIRDYAPSGSLPMSRKGYTATAYWHVDSATGSIKINGSTKYATTRALVQAMGKDDQLKKGNITVKLYPAWEKNDSMSNGDAGE